MAVAVVVEDGGDLGNEATGGKLSAPIAKAVMEAILGDGRSVLHWVRGLSGTALGGCPHDRPTERARTLGERYQLGELIGRGGMAEVHVGRDLRLGRTVAIKLLRIDLARDPSFQARFRREAQSAAALNHPNIVAVYDTGEEPMLDGVRRRAVHRHGVRAGRDAA